jgi:hypothetical protein
MMTTVAEKATDAIFTMKSNETVRTGLVSGRSGQVGQYVQALLPSFMPSLLVCTMLSRCLAEFTVCLYLASSPAELLLKRRPWVMSSLRHSLRAKRAAKVIWPSEAKEESER